MDALKKLVLETKNEDSYIIVVLYYSVYRISKQIIEQNGL